MNMRKKKLTVITEGGQKFGFGHITRCLSIANTFKQHDYTISFIVNGDESLSSMLHNTNYVYYSWLLDSERLLKELSQTSLILIDSMKISNSLILKIQELSIPIIFIDDEKRRNILEKGFVIDWTVLSDKKEYFIPKKENVTYLLGSTYTPLRHEFIDAKQNNIRKKIKRIMITFGGSDIHNLTVPILEALKTNFPQIIKNIIIGPGFQNIQEIQNSKDENTKLIFNADTKKMIETMQNSDLAIASGGQTLYELARIGLPAIAILLVENAKDDTYGWNEVGCVKYIGWYDDKNLFNNLTHTVNILEDKTERLKMQNNAQKYINPNGTKFLVDSILEKLT